MSAHGVQSIDRAVSILRCFSHQSQVLSLSDLSRATGLSTSTTHRLLSSMHANRLVRQLADRRYTLGSLPVQLVRAGAAPTTLRDAALPVMTVLRNEVDETVGLHELLPSNERVVVDQVESHHPLRRTYTELGEPIALPYGAPGKLMLALLPASRRDAVLARPIVAGTPTTLTDPAALRRQLDEIRSRRFAVSYAERIPGVRSVSGPIFDQSGGVAGALSISGPEVRLSDERLWTLGPRVRDAAWAVSEILGATKESVHAGLMTP